MPASPIPLAMLAAVNDEASQWDAAAEAFAARGAGIEIGPARRERRNRWERRDVLPRYSNADLQVVERVLQDLLASGRDGVRIVAQGR
ncbi:hypothetical protein HNP40_002980 [Mycobacteroides chelonae]|nr:hypothetical protein [Mycobacteroides chelonae]